MSTPNPALVRDVLQWIARGQIVAVDGVPQHRSDVLPPHALSLFQALHRHGYLTLPSDSASPPVAVLSAAGTQLLDRSVRQPDTPCPLDLLAREDSSASARAVAEAVTRAPQA